MKNNFGNFVVQKAIKVSVGESNEKLISSISKNIERLGDRKIINKWKGLITSGAFIPSNQDINIQNNDTTNTKSQPNYLSKANVMDYEQLQVNLTKSKNNNSKISEQIINFNNFKLEKNAFYQK